MQKEQVHNRGQTHYNQQNPQMIYTSQYQPLSAHQTPIMQRQVMYSVNNGQTQPIRHINMAPRMAQFASAPSFIPGGSFHTQRSEVVQNSYAGYPVQQQTYMQTGGQQQFSYQAMGYQAPRGHQPVYIMSQGGYNQNLLVMQQQMTHSQPQQFQQQHVYSQQHVQSNQGQQTQMQTHLVQQLQLEQQPQKTRTTITLKDPNTGEDLTNEVFKKKDKPARSAALILNASTPPLPKDDIKSQVNAAFAAKVAAAASSASSSPATVQSEAKTNDSGKADSKPSSEIVKLPDEQVQINLLESAPENTKTDENNDNKLVEKTSELPSETEKSENDSESINVSVPNEDSIQNIDADIIPPVETSEKNIDKVERIEVNDTKKEEDTKQDIVTVPQEITSTQEIVEETVSTETEAEVESTPEIIVEATPEFIVEATPEIIVEATPEFIVEATPEIIVEATPEFIVEATPEIIVEATPEFIVEATPEIIVEATPKIIVEADTSTSNTEDVGDSLLNGHDETAKTGSAFSAVTKKKKKNRFKDIESKDNNNDMLSAFTDKPTIEETPEKQPEPPKVPEKSLEDATWEEKEKTIEKEVIRSEDAEEPEVVPKMAETRIIKSEDTPKTMEEDEKLQYDRDFLLKFQFAPICTSKPDGLPNIDIVLDQAHAPTKALVPGQRISASNDFMPTFMRQASGGRSSGGGRSKDRRGPSSSGSARPQKVIQVPQFEKVELKKSENAWVRPAQQVKELPEEQRVMDELSRNVRSILNKLTPQKFKTLVDKMFDLKIDNARKLENAIDLIFEKAVGEPGFSVAYANMCRVLTDSFKVPVTQDKQASVVTFRKVLLNKCQKEFEKESSDEKLLEEDRNKQFDTEEEKKAWKEQLDYREMMNRRRMLGNIRFIGELFKLKMISENIMHDCIFKLLRSEKQDSLEDQLECLCKLLSTIGKDLDHKKAKPRMDQYFVQIQKIIGKKKITSRIKFALRDVIDLRGNNWVPRRDEGNPKTIDQIHKEAQQKEREQEIARQQDKLQKRSDPHRGRGGGRDSPSVRGSGPSQAADGWTNVPAKSGRPVSAAPVDASRFKLAKKSDAEISLGPGGRPGAWSRGASGGGSRSGSGSNTPTNEVDQRPNNRFDPLSDSSVAPSSVDVKSRGGSRQQGTHNKRGTPPIGKRPSDDRSAALRAVKDMTGKSSRNQSPARSTLLDGEISRSNPSSGSQTPVESSRSPNPLSVTEGIMRKKTKSTVEEYFSCKDVKEAILCIKELNAPELHHIFVEEVIIVAIEKKPEQRCMVGTLVCYLMKENVITLPQMCQGLAAIVEFAQDLAVDIPLIYKYLGEFLGPIVYDGTLPLNKVKEALEPLVQLNKAGLVMAEALSVAVQIAGTEDLVTTLWFASNITWNMLLNNDEDVEQFIKDKKMEFTLQQISRSKPLCHASKIQQEMLKLLRRKTDNNDVFTLIEEKVPLSEQNSVTFIREITGIVCSTLIKQDESDCVCNKEIIKYRANILLRYINGNKEFELHAVFALQKLVHDLNHPRDILHILFEELYHSDVISEETFYVWEKSKEFPDGKGVALSSVKGFLTWLRKADEESNEEESSTPQALLTNDA